MLGFCVSVELIVFDMYICELDTHANVAKVIGLSVVL